MSYEVPKIIVLITGANQGVGYEAAKILLAHSTSYHVIIGARDSSKGEAAKATLEALPETRVSVSVQLLDVTDDASVDKAAVEVDRAFGRLDVLVNNAGVLSLNPDRRANLRQVLATNVVGAVSVTEAFLPLLRKCASKAPRLVFVNSSMGSITHARDPESPYYRPQADEYRASKAALNMLMVQYYARLKLEEGLDWKVHGADPGLTATNFGFNNPTALASRGAVPPAVGGERIATVIRGDRDGVMARVCGEYGVQAW